MEWAFTVSTVVFSVITFIIDWPLSSNVIVLIVTASIYSLKFNHSHGFFRVSIDNGQKNN